MLKKYMLICLSLFMLLQVHAQRGEIRGTIISAQTGEALSGASIQVKGQNGPVLSDKQGRFALRVQGRQVIVVSFVGHASQELSVDHHSRSLTITLQPAAEELGEVEVTGALGIKRAAREIGGGAQVVSNSSLNQGKTINPIFGLTSKVAGLRINMYDSKVDPQVRIVLRGNRSLQRTTGIDGRGANEPIYVVDGMPVPDINRLNPKDIESITVLKGANAAALYGSEGVNGALMITTKTGKKGRGVVKFSNTTTFSNAYLLPPAQTKYGQGANGVYDPIQTESWGPAFDGTLKNFGTQLPDGTQPQVLYAAPGKDARLDLFQTGLNVQNDISFSGGDERSTYFMSAQHVSVKGIIPQDKNQRTGLRFNGSRKFGKLNASYNVNYVYNDKNTTPDGPWIGAYQLPANFPYEIMEDWTNPLSPGNPLNYFSPTGTSNLKNPYFQIGNIRDEAKQQILNGKIELDYQVASWFKAIYRIGMYSLSEQTRSTTGKFAATGTRNVAGIVTDASSTYRRINSDLILNFNKDFGKISTRLILGQNIRTDYKNTISVGVSNSGGSGQLLYPDVVNIGSRTGNLAGSTGITEYRSLAGYGELVLGYDNYLFLTLTGRNDRVSVLSKQNSSYFYPGVSVAYVFTDVLNYFKDNSTISYGKAFASWNRTGNVPLAPYQLNNSYSQANGFPFGDIAGFLPSTTTPNADLKPEFVSSYEAGLQLSFFKNRLNFEGSYIYAESKGQILDANISRGTGYAAAKVNAGYVTNSIVELSVNGDVLRSRDFKWNMGFNFTYTNNQVKELYGGATERNNFRQSYGIVGEAFPTLLVSDYKRDPMGRVVVDGSTGDPIIAAKNTMLGTLVPPYLMGISSMFQYKGFTLGAQFDWRMGGWLYSEIVPRMYTAGTDPRTTEFDRQPFVYPNSVIEVSEGKFEANTSKLTSSGGRAFWTKQGEVQINTAAKADFFKLRELNLTYCVPKYILGRQKFIENVSLSLVATNLFIIRHQDNKYGDPEYLYNNTDGYISFRQVPPFRSYGFNVNLTF